MPPPTCRWSGLTRLGHTTQAAEHRPEDRAVHRVEHVPVGETDVPRGIEYGGLADLGAVPICLDLELQPQAPGDLHLGGEQEPTAVVDALDAPEVDGVADVEIVRIPASAPHSLATAQPVDQAAQVPEPVHAVPPGPATDALDRGEHVTRAGGDVLHAGGHHATPDGA